MASRVYSVLQANEKLFSLRLVVGFLGVSKCTLRELVCFDIGQYRLLSVMFCRDYPLENRNRNESMILKCAWKEAVVI